MQEKKKLTNIEVLIIQPQVDEKPIILPESQRKLKKKKKKISVQLIHLCNTCLLFIHLRTRTDHKIRLNTWPPKPCVCS